MLALLLDSVYNLESENRRLGRWGRVRPPDVGERGLSDGLVAERIDGLTICVPHRVHETNINHSPGVTKDDNLKGA